MTSHAFLIFVVMFCYLSTSKFSSLCICGNFVGYGFIAFPDLEGGYGKVWKLFDCRKKSEPLAAGFAYLRDY